MRPLHGDGPGALMCGASHRISGRLAGPLAQWHMRRRQARAFIYPNIILSGREVAAFSYRCSQGTLLCNHSSKLFTHMNTITCIIPAETEDGQLLEIPRSAWNEVEKVAKEEFGVDVNIFFNDGPVEFEGGPLVPFPHYAIEATLERGEVKAFRKRIDPLIKDVVEHHAQLPSLATN